jgi:hypothetical protein
MEVEMGYSKCSKSLKLALAAALALTAAGAYAGEITLFQKSGFQGRNMTAIDAVPNLERSAFNEVASSIIVNDGTWEACTETYFRGRCAQLTPGQYSRLSRDLGLIASVRQVGVAPSSGRIIIGPDSVAMSTNPIVVERAPVVIDRQPVVVAQSQPVIVAPEIARLPAGPRITLYQHTSRGIRAVDVTADTGNLSVRSFDNRADAAFVTGGVWRLCDGPNGQGECFDYGPGTYPTLGTLNQRVESAFLISSLPQPTVSSVAPIQPGRLVVYQFQNFGGPSAVVENGRAPDMDWANFRYPPASLRVESGSWLICPELGYQGDCRVYGPGEYPTLGTPLERGIASARQVWRPEYSSLETYRFMGN